MGDLGDSLAALPHGLLLALSPGETQPKAPNPTSAKNLLHSKEGDDKTSQVSSPANDVSLLEGQVR